MFSRALLLLPIAALLTPTGATADWNGAYGGITFGNVTDLSYEITADIDPDVDFDDVTSFGGFFGGHSSNGAYVIGYEIAFESLNDASEFGGDAQFRDAHPLAVTPARSAPVGGLV